MKSVIVLAMHGIPPNDFPQQEAAELFGLHAHLEHARGPERPTLERRYAELEARVRAWPRTAQNDPFHAGSHELAGHLGQALGCPVIVGFNEFCGPSLDEALDQAAALSPERMVVVTPMVTRGGEHSEADIPSAIQRAQNRHPRVPIHYAWPFAPAEVAEFLATQIRRWLE